MTPERRGRATDAAVIVVAWSFAIAQPLLDVLGKNPAFFVAHSATKVDILAFALGLTLIVPLILAGIVTVIGLINATAGRIAHRLVLGLLVAEFGLQVLKQFGHLPGVLEIAIPLAIGGFAAWLYDQRANLRSFTWWLAPAPIFFLVLFLASPVNGLIFTQSVAAGPGVTVDKPMPVVLILFDELPVISLMKPDGTLDRAAYPNFARLADRSTWFRNTTADWPNTERSIPTILTGKIHTAEVPTASENPQNIFTLLGGGFKVEGWEAITKLCPDTICDSAQSSLSTSTRVNQLLDDTRVVAGHVLLPDDLSKSLPPIDQSWAQFNGEKTPASGSSGGSSGSKGSGGSGIAADDTAAGTPTSAPVGSRQQMAYADPSAAINDLDRTLGNAGTRNLYVVHLKFPHFPWRYVPTGQQYGGANALPGYKGTTWENDPVLPNLGLARHLLQIRYTDQLLGRVLDRMDATGLTNRAMLVVTADHGAAFEPGGPRRDPDQAVLGDIAYVPLFVHVPGAPARTDNRPARLDDIVPTIADALHVRARGWKWDGTSLLEPAEAKRDRVMTNMSDQALQLAASTSARDEALRRRWTRYPGLTSLSDWANIFKVGPLGSLVGSPAPGGADLDGAQLDLDQQAQLSGYDPNGPIAPVMLTGTLKGVPSGRDFAISVNGKVAGVGRSYDTADFTGLINPTALIAGENDVEVFVSQGSGFRRVPLANAGGWKVEQAADGSQTLVSSDGTRVPIAVGAVTGYVSGDERAGIYTVHGWAAAPTQPDGKPVRIVVFKGSTYLGSSVTGQPRPDVAEKLNDPRYATSGFSIDLPNVKARDRKKVTAYAVYGNQASALSFIDR